MKLLNLAERQTETGAAPESDYMYIVVTECSFTVNKLSS